VCWPRRSRSLRSSPRVPRRTPAPPQPPAPWRRSPRSPRPSRPLQAGTQDRHRGDRVSRWQPARPQLCLPQHDEHRTKAEAHDRWRAPHELNFVFVFPAPRKERFPNFALPTASVPFLPTAHAAQAGWHQGLDPAAEAGGQGQGAGGRVRYGTGSKMRRCDAARSGCARLLMPMIARAPVARLTRASLQTQAARRICRHGRMCR
jgi:hypothetical protein